MEVIFAEAQRLRLWRPLDVQFARMLASPPNQHALMLAIACLSASNGVGHVCLPLKLLIPERLFDGRMPSLALKAWALAGYPSLNDWEQLLLLSPAVSDGSCPTPLVLENQCLYLQRMWQYECVVAEFFNRQRPALPIDKTQLSSVLGYIFPYDGSIEEIDWQKIAVTIAMTRQIALISGGPGTGKTSIVAKLLVALLKLNSSGNLRIVMAAPTGRAAVCLSKSIGLALQDLELNADQKQWLPYEATTLHRLLGVHYNMQQIRYHYGNPLHIDILVIDEASMIDLAMMANLILALPTQARVIFLGDRDQLSSVESGVVFGDICQFADFGYSFSQRSQLMQLTGFTIGVRANNYINSCNIADSVCLLRKSYRFNEESGIGLLANAINTGNASVALSLLKDDMFTDINYMPLHNLTEYELMLDNCVKCYREYLQLVHNHDTPSTILSAFNRFCLLCALRDGPFGVVGLNDYIEQSLCRVGMLTTDDISTVYYAGRPVVIMRNSPLLGLYNGDIGIILKEENVLRVYFSQLDGKIKVVPLSQLPEHETAFAMTVHKSQGSEFQHVTLILPNQILPVLTRNLLYTAVTRSLSRFSVYATDELLNYIILTKIQRCSGLIERLTSR